MLVMATCATADAAIAPPASLPTLFLTSGDGRLAYDDTGGSGLLVIAVPGLGDLRQEYRYLTPLLHDAGYRVATVDLRGFGETSAQWSDYSARAIGDDLVRLETRLGRSSAILAGSSYAAGSAIWAAHDAPGRVSALILLGPVLRDPAVPASWWSRTLMALAFAGPWREALWLRYWDSLFISRVPPDQSAYRRALARNLRQPGRMRALDLMLHASKAATAEIVGQVRTPALIVMGSRDPDQDDPASEAAWITRTTGGRVVLVNGAGHYPQTEMPAQVGAACVDFLRDVVKP